jgi:hypothetical protein
MLLNEQTIYGMDSKYLAFISHNNYSANIYRDRTATNCHHIIKCNFYFDPKFCAKLNFVFISNAVRHFKIILHLPQVMKNVEMSCVRA